MFKKLFGLLALVPVLGLSCFGWLDSAAPVQTDALTVTGWNVTLHAVGGDFSVRRPDSSTVTNLQNGSQYSFTDVNLATDWTVDVSAPSGNAWSAYIDNGYGEFHWHSKPAALGLPWYEGNVDVYLYNGYDDVFDWGYLVSDSWITVKASRDDVDDVRVGALANYNYNAGYDAGQSAGYDAGYQAGVAYGRSSFPDVNQGVYFQWDTGYQNSNTYTVSWSKSSGISSSAVVSYSTPTQYFERTAGESVTFSIVCNQGGGGNIPFFVGFTTQQNQDMQILDSSLMVNGVFYLPWWEGSMTFLIIPNSTDSTIKRYDFSLSYGENIANIRVLSSYAQGYQNGYAAGSSAGYSNGYDVGWTAGDARYQEGYEFGYGVGYRTGFLKGQQAGETVQVVDIWPLISAVVTMPFTFLTQGFDWTLFKGSPYEFGVSTFIGTVFVLLMVWKIFKLVIGMRS